MRKSFKIELPAMFAYKMRVAIRNAFSEKSLHIISFCGRRCCRKDLFRSDHPRPPATTHKPILEHQNTHFYKTKALQW